MVNRDYLRGLSAQMDHIVEGFINEVKAAAGNGETYFLFEKGRYEYMNMTADILIPVFKNRFVGCKVYYRENWNFPESYDRILIRGIYIDWS